MQPRHVYAISSILFLACAPAGGDDTGGADASEGSGIVLDPDASSSATAAASATTAPDDPGSATTGGAPACRDDDDCGAMELCVDQVCKYDIDWCGEPRIAEVFPPQVMLVLDKSGSMVLNDWDHDADPDTPELTRWRSLHGVVEGIVAGFDAQMELGAVLFPSLAARANYAQACLMSATPETPVGPLQGAVVLAALPPADADGATIQGGTPATAGIKLAVEHLSGREPGPRRYLVLVTDGAANCKEDPASTHEIADVYDEALAPTVAAAHAEHGIATFVVGVDIQDITSPVLPDGQPDATNTHERLNEVAIAGGMPRPGPEKFHNAQNQLELAAALTAIAQQVSCVIALDPLPTADQRLDVELHKDALDEVQTCDSGAGWRFLDPVARDAIELCPDTCAAYQAQQSALTVTYRCKPQG